MLERIEETREFLPQKDPLDYLQKKLRNENPLDYLYNKVTLQFSQNENAKNKQQKLDRDLDLLRMLLNEDRQFTWKQLYILSRYTVNFNPAVESILKAEVPVQLTKDNLWI
ncbi:hypothetical protein F7734_44855 [Scytonema sp. UIC 10036]|uniref:hypothetical protein n=1 Tax=Scytonema sp. UIC 10036 TaxID=2304196 RepID=UPI0012DADAF7|nr:hypothetical protein [Scytonema sp. UIC 10036]MUG99049.1 hypothetical protein [Scytonema sp. UIC 10036]